MTFKKFYFEKIKKRYQNAEFHADFKSVGKVFKSAIKKIISKTIMTT
jgi:hypothetical protein